MSDKEVLKFAAKVVAVCAVIGGFIGGITYADPE